MLDYAELHCISNFTFLRGASHPEELVARAAELGYRALALTDECSLGGVVRAHLAAKQHALHLIIGSEFQLDDGLRIVLLATDRESYGRLSSLISLARRNADKGSYRLTRAQLAQHRLDGCLALWLPSSNEGELAWLTELFTRRLWIAVELSLTGKDQAQRQRLQRLGEKYALPLCACGNVQMHQRCRRVLYDTLTAIRLNTALPQLGRQLAANAEHHLRSLRYLAVLYPKPWLDESWRIAGSCRFSLDELRYEYPRELVPEDYSPSAWLRKQVELGARRRWPKGVPDKVRDALEYELALVAELAYEPYFLTVYDIVCFARRQGILCQGRGSAANSAICYCLGITEVDPERMNLLFERFISKERNEPPDIDVDFEHERREEVIQYIYKKYGRERAALAATVITYRPRSAIRDVGKALGLSAVQIERLARSHRWWDGQALIPERLGELGFAPDNPLIRRLAVLVEMLLGFPRHLSQHVGGFVISAGPLIELVPVENAAMKDRTVIQWEKHDLEALGLLKVDVLALGMLSAIRKALAYIGEYRGRTVTLADIPAEDSEVYAMLRRADTVGVFQIESRAQMSMLPRLRPRNYYDLVIQVAIVRPCLIQGDMVHPYLARRSGREPVTYPNPEVKSVLQRTLGVPIFQEQVMQLAMVAAGFTAGEADQLRRAMAAWKRKGGLEAFEAKLLAGMRERGYSDGYARQIFRQIRGFGDYGFPESHAASFALLAYVSSWLKRHHPAAFVCALLNSQPMGFYAPAQLIQDAKRHGVVVRPIDVMYSSIDCALDYQAKLGETQEQLLSVDSPLRDKLASCSVQPALRLGLRMVKGLSSTGMQALLTARAKGRFADVHDLARRAGLNRVDLEALAAADGLRSLSGDRHRAQWQVSGIEAPLPLLSDTAQPELDVMLPKADEGQDIIADYASSGLSLRRHPVALLRPRLARRGVRSANELWSVRNGAIAQVAGLVIGRQRPGTATGVIFVTLEDETGHANVVIWAKVAERQRKTLLQSRLLLVSGTVQQEEGVLHLVAGRLEDLSSWLGALQIKSRDFH
jgi:error-prone DNA polymerase